MLALGRKLAPLACVLAFVACSSGTKPSATPSSTASSRPSSTAQLAITSPQNGQTVKGPTVHVEVSLTGAKIVAVTTTNLKPDEGHLHVKLDGQLQSMTAGTTFNVEDVQPGSHSIQVEFVASDHVPFDPRVVAGVSFVAT